MMKKRICALLTAGFLMFSMTAGVLADVEDDLAYAREQKAEAESALAAAQAQIGGLEYKKQELQEYLSGIRAEYEAISSELEKLELEEAEKTKKLMKLKRKLKVTQKKKQKQYDAMKLRIAYIYENGEQDALMALLSAKNLGEFVSRAMNVSELSRYDREMLEKYEETCRQVTEKETSLNKKVEAIHKLQEEKGQKQQELSELADRTSADIQSYVAQISASEQEAAALMAQASAAEEAIWTLAARAEEERAAALAAAYEEDSGDEAEDSSGESSDEDWEEDGSGGEASYDEEAYEEASYEEDSYEEDSYEEDSYEEEASQQSYESSYEDSYEESGSGQGTYLGSFKLTGYCNCAQCCGSAGNATASGVMPSSGHTVAMAGVPFGTQLLINGNVYTVEDLGTPYGHVDIYFDNHSDALAFGLQYADVYQVS